MSLLTKIRAGVLGLGLLALTGGLTVWGSTRAVSPPAPVPAVPQQVAQTADQWICPLPTQNSLGAVDLQESQEHTEITPVGALASLTYDSRTLSTSAPTLMDSADGGVLTATGSGEGTAVGVVTSVSAAGDLRGLTAAPCSMPSAVSWFVGGSVALGSSSELRLTNPGVTTVTATISMYGSTGPVDLPSGGEVSVPAGRTVAVLLEASGADDERIALSVSSESGTLVPSLAVESLDGETAAGTEVLAPGAAPGTDLTVPAVVMVEDSLQGYTEPDAEATSSDTPVLRVVNPSPSQEATVSVTLLGAEGPTPLAGAQELVVDPGAVFDVSLEGIAPGAYGIRVQSDTPVGAAVRLVRSAGELPARSGSLLHDIAWVQAAPAATPGSVVALPRQDSLSPQLVLSSRDGVPATVTISSADATWSTQVTVPAGGTVAPEVPAEVNAVVLSGEDLSHVAAAGVVSLDVGGDAAGQLLAVVPALGAADALPQRSVIMR